jgi:hypothetical protein
VKSHKELYISREGRKGYVEMRVSNTRVEASFHKEIYFSS